MLAQSSQKWFNWWQLGPSPLGKLWEPGQNTRRALSYTPALDRLSLGVEEESQFWDSPGCPIGYCLHWLPERIIPFFTCIHLINLIRPEYYRV